MPSPHPTAVPRVAPVDEAVVEHVERIAAGPPAPVPTPPPAGADAREWFERLWSLRPTSFLRRIPGRETFFFPDADGRFVAKRTRGQAARERWYDLLHGGRFRAPAVVEAQNLFELELAGFPVPRAVAAFVPPPRRGPVRSFLVMERVAHDADLRTAFADADAPRRAAWLDELAELVARLHANGFYHRDLYFQHVVLPRQPRAKSSFVLLDCGRVRRSRRPRERWFVKDLAALAHSRPAALDDVAWRGFVARYAAARGLGADVRAFAAAVEAKSARLAAHAPRHVDPEGGRPSRA